METMKRKYTHIVICSLKYQGHIRPAMMLAYKLASLGFSITIILPHKHTMPLVTSHVDGLDIVITNLEHEQSSGDDDEELVDASQSSRSYIEVVGVRGGVSSEFKSEDYTIAKQSLEKLLSKLKSSPSPPACVIVDMLLSWTEEPISKVGLPRFIFFAAAANFLTQVLHIKSLFDQGILPIAPALKKETLDKHQQVLGLPMKLRWYDFHDAMVDSSHNQFDIHIGWIQHLFGSAGILFNTFAEFEGGLFDALQPKLNQLLLPIGPLFPEEYFGEEAIGAMKAASFFRSSDKEQELCHQWLELQLPGSVVYVSFGSWAALSKRQIQELAIGLEMSNHRFMWVVNHQEEVESVLPPGFIQRNSGKGLVITEWAPQHLILSHKSVGAFLTHCGWNSVLECVTLAGVPLIGWPFLGDQASNCRYLVDGVKIAVEVFGDEEGFVSSNEVEKALKEAMEGPKSEAMRSKAKFFQAAAKKAVEKDESSQKNFETFVANVGNA